MSSIKDVASLAEVSISTVSRVLNNSCPVSEDKRQRVLAAAAQLGYVPNPAARSLLLHKTGVIGVVIPFASGEFFSEFLSGVDQTAADREYFLLISISRRNEADLLKAIRSLDKRVDGLVVWAPEMGPSEVINLVSGSTPVLLVNGHDNGFESDCVDFDNHGGMTKVVEYLLDLGHRDIAFIAGPPAAVDAKARLKAFREALRKRGVSPQSDLEFRGRFTIEDGFRAAQRILEMARRPTAIVASNDQSAFGALRALREAGVEVPRDISVTGFDDVPSASFFSPPLTTARVPVRRMGEVVINTLLDRIVEGRTSFE
ncbi:MAG: LacI family transcriptional regulator, partial [Rhodothermia bacterium]|nr:LacI family transcriptional regulator [Rhodothermia bacterium]